MNTITRHELSTKLVLILRKMPAQKCATLQRASNLSAHEKEVSIRANAWRADCANASESKKTRSAQTAQTAQRAIINVHL